MNCNKKNRKPFMLLVAACLAVSLLVACGQGGADISQESGKQETSENAAPSAEINEPSEDEEVVSIVEGPAGDPVVEVPAHYGDMNMKDFNAKTLDGDAFTQEDLAKYDLTAVNIWTTWCGSCIDEMPEWQRLYTEMLPDNVNFITICADGDEMPAVAKDTMEKQGCTFKALIADQKLVDSLLTDVQAFPTTIFVDKEGNIVGESQVGTPSEDGDIAAGYLKIINERLALVTT